MNRIARKRFIYGAWPILRKEVIHILRDPATLYFALFIPMFELLLFGFALDTKVRQIKTIVYDAAGTQESKRLLDRFTNTDDFHIIEIATSDRELYNFIIEGRGKVGIKIPVDYSRRLQDGRTASVLVLVDGSDSTVTGEAVNVANQITLQESLRQVLGDSGGKVLPVEARQSVLFNPDLRSPNFLIPGMIAILLQMINILLISFSLVREREKGTLEQLYLTPITPLGVMVGKMLPYGFLGFIEVCGILVLMRFVFEVPIAGSLFVLFGVSLPFLLTVLGLGLLISVRARSQVEAVQMASGSILPSVFLSGYIFPIENMPVFFQWVSALVPATYYINALRAIILRGAGVSQMWSNGLVLSAMGIVTILIATVQFKKKTV
ncbi:MAG: ABC transporter permease [Blastocatellia bacterium]|nr:ABC transporter permease [Blastocatellia bacterium]